MKMTASPVAILSIGLVTPVGLTVPAACAAIRAGLTNPTETRFMTSSGEWITGHQVPLEKQWGGRTRLAKMAALAIRECLTALPSQDWADIPLVLCVAESGRPGRLDGLEDRLPEEIQEELGARFAGQTFVVPHGRVSLFAALMHARELMASSSTPRVLIVSTDSLLSGPTLSSYDRNRRLLGAANSNGFQPGEGAGAILIGPRTRGQLMCTGVGVGVEPAHIDSGQPLRSDGLVQAIKAALLDAGSPADSLDFRITDIAGEQYYFKEASLALSRLLRTRKEEFDIWNPAESIGESGAMAGAAMIAIADAACRKGYAPGTHILLHAANDDGKRGAAIFRFPSEEGSGL